MSMTKEQRAKVLASIRQKEASSKATIQPKTSQEEFDEDTVLDAIEDQMEEVEDGETSLPEPPVAKKSASNLKKIAKRRAYKKAQAEYHDQVDEIVDEDVEFDDTLTEADSEEQADSVAEEVAEEVAEIVVETIGEGEVSEEQLEMAIEDALEPVLENVARRHSVARKLKTAKKATQKEADTKIEVSDDLVKDTGDDAPLPTKSTEVDIAVSDDLEEKSITPSDTDIDNGDGVEPPAGASTASLEADMREKFVTAMEFVKASKALGVIEATARDTQEVDKAIATHSVEAMKLATECMHNVRSAAKVAGAGNPSPHVPAPKQAHTNQATTTRSEYGLFM